MKQRTIHILACEQDRELLEPVLDALRTQGFRTEDMAGTPGQNDAVLAVLTEAFYADKGKRQAVLDSIAAGVKTVIPLQLDGSPVPRDLKDLLYARNIISAEGRSAEQTAERIRSAIPPGGMPKWLPWVIAGAGALAVVLGIALSRPFATPVEQQEPVPMAEAVQKPDLPVPDGITPEDLEKIEGVVIVGPNFYTYTMADYSKAHAWPDWEYTAYEGWDDGRRTYFNKENGQEVELTRYDDLRFLSLMPKLSYLNLVEVDPGLLPDCSEIAKLKYVKLYNCEIDSLDWLAGSPVKELSMRGCPVTDYSPLTRCDNLRKVDMSFDRAENPELAQFAPPGLMELSLSFDDARTGDLSGLAACDKLWQVYLYGLRMEDLNFLSAATGLERLEVRGSESLKDISVLSKHSVLKHLFIDDCRKVRDFSAISNCRALEEIQLSNMDQLHSLAFLTGLPKLKKMDFWGIGDLDDLEFLNGMGGRRIELGMHTRVRDYSALEHVPFYDRLQISMGNGNAATDLMPFLSKATIRELSLDYFPGLNLEDLPNVTERLRLQGCDFKDLSGMPELGIVDLELENMERMTSLSGIEHLKHIERTSAVSLSLQHCPRLTDWSAIEQLRLSRLELKDLFSLPDFSGMSITSLRLENIPDLTDLHLLDGLKSAFLSDLELVGLDELRDLMPLKRMRIDRLVIPPHLQEQAEELVQSGSVKEFRVEYPDRGWDQDEQSVELLSMDELQTMPKSFLRHVTRLSLAGDTLFNRDEFDVQDRWTGGKNKPYLVRWETDEETPLEKGTLIRDFGTISDLTGLRELNLYQQPLKTLDGIQGFPDIERLKIEWCDGVTDASPAFSMQELRELSLDHCPVTSIQGIQNLRELQEVSIAHTKVTDLTPLAECDFSSAYEQGGLILNINDLKGLDQDDFDALGSVRVFRNLAFDDADPAVWMPALKNSQILCIGAAGDLRSNEALSQFAADHPEIQSLFIGGDDRITDLRCLVGLENLERISVNREMKKAIASLDGLEYGFELEIMD